MMHSPQHFEGLMLLLVPLFLIIGLVAFAFWVWMLVDCLTNQGLDSNERIVWVVVIALTHWLGALIYLCVARSKRLQPLIPPPQT